MGDRSIRRIRNLNRSYSTRDSHTVKVVISSYIDPSASNVNVPSSAISSIRSTNSTTRNVLYASNVIHHSITISSSSFRSTDWIPTRPPDEVRSHKSRSVSTVTHKLPAPPPISLCPSASDSNVSSCSDLMTMTCIPHIFPSLLCCILEYP